MIGRWITRGGFKVEIVWEITIIIDELPVSHLFGYIHWILPLGGKIKVPSIWDLDGNSESLLTLKTRVSGVNAEVEWNS